MSHDSSWCHHSFNLSYISHFCTVFYVSLVVVVWRSRGKNLCHTIVISCFNSILVELLLNQIKIEHKTITHQTHNPTHANRLSMLDFKTKSYFIFCSLVFWSFLFRVRNHASQICLLIHIYICCRCLILQIYVAPHSLFFPNKLLFEHVNTIRFAPRRRIDWLNYGFSCQLKWRSLNETIKIHSFLWFWDCIFYYYYSCASSSIESHCFFDVLLSCAWIYIYGVATLFCIEINYSSKRRHSVVNSTQQRQHNRKGL
jgi:hypothetical protein